VLGDALERTTSPDAAIDTNDPTITKKVAQKYNTVVVSTGETDVITDGSRVAFCSNGHEMMANITASGCVFTAVLAACIAVAEDQVYDASIEAAASYAIAGEIAAENARGPGSFIPAFLDELYLLNEDTYDAREQVER